MTDHRDVMTFAESFQQGLGELRSKVETLPEEQQPRLQALIDGAERECGKLHRQCATFRDAVGDLRLATKYAEFDLEATAREIEQEHRHSGFG